VWVSPENGWRGSAVGFTHCPVVVRCRIRSRHTRRGRASQDWCILSTFPSSRANSGSVLYQQISALARTVRSCRSPAGGVSPASLAG
jgi:hypothetical protein